MRVFGFWTLISLCLITGNRVRAEEEKSPFGDTTGNVSLTSDYMVRGQTQTDHGPALQAGVDWNHPLGFYAGAWGSNVHFPASDPASLELDVLGGYGLQWGGSVRASVGFIYCLYFPSSSYNNWEIPLKLTWQSLRAQVSYLVPTAGNFSTGSWYLNGGWSDTVFWEFILGASAGYTFTHSSNPNDSYADFRLHISREMLGVLSDVSFILVDTRQFGASDDPRVVLTVSKSF